MAQLEAVSAAAYFIRSDGRLWEPSQQETIAQQHGTLIRRNSGGCANELIKLQFGCLGSSAGQPDMAPWAEEDRKMLV
ncbi:hypothetical protein Ciccas_001987 [Cichlidogyrus casuarinus]|uniref:Uncharacterized protein n=1 Tax=Cichlidogyrus casuarinus TaxID=1844966 RepID=A0ABD2QIH3_9PLAT